MDKTVTLNISNGLNYVDSDSNGSMDKLKQKTSRIHRNSYFNTKDESIKFLSPQNQTVSR